jgi:hypothetical protein
MSLVLTSSDYIQIIVAIIYGIALFYTVVTFRRAKELDQISITETIFNDLRELDRELSKIPSGSQHDTSREQLYTRILNTVDWLCYLINKKVISDRRMIEYMRPTLIQYHQDTFVQKILSDGRYSNSFPEYRKLYQKLKTT